MSRALRGFSGLMVLAGAASAGSYINLKSIRHVELYGCEPVRVATTKGIKVLPNESVCKARVTFDSVTYEGGMQSAEVPKTSFSIRP